MPVSDQTPNVVITDSTETPMEVSGGVLVPTGTKGILAVGVQTNGTASFLSLSSAGALIITGSITQSGTSTITGSIGVANFPVTQSVSGSVGISGVPTVTGSVSVLNTVTITGSVNTTLSNPTLAGSGSSAPPTGSLVGGKDTSGNFQPIAVTTGGFLFVSGNVSASIVGTPTITGSISVTNVPTVTGSITVPNTVTVTGSIGVNGLSFASGALAVFVSGTNTQPVTGSITVSNTVTVTGSVTVPNIVTVTGSVGINGYTDPDSTVVGTLNALNAAITLDLSGAQGVGFQLLAGTLIGTIIAEISYDNGTTWAPTGFFDVDTKGLSDTVVFGSANGTIIKGLMIPQGAGLVRVRVSAFTSGTATGQIRANLIASQVVYSSPLDGRRTTYGGATAAFASAASATDIFIIQGSATRLIRVLRIQVYATQTTAGAASVFLIKRSTANTAGTAVATTKVPFDSSSPAATATVQHYTANPTVGAIVGNVQGYRGVLPQANSLIKNPLVEWEFGTRPGQAIVLRGTAEGLAVNLNGVTVTGGSFIIVAEWTEE